MEKTTLEKISYSINELEVAVYTARKIILNLNPHPFSNHMKRMFLRLDEYDKIIIKEKTLFAEVCQLWANPTPNNLRSIRRLINLISKLSAMIRDDVKTIKQNNALTLNLVQNYEEIAYS
ncbi:MAG: hypothetical protein LBE20_07520 [Deltaproteobacteria bacterium]|jgi:hypothetical protein|nr:hypothetical protein [Deltaproteobacteria bacterium]